MDRKLKHLDFIQGVINRLSTNSFLLKGWSVILVSALFALSTGNSNIKFIILAYLPALAFWGLDAYFLALERSYRDLYEKVRIKDPEEIDFSMKLEGLSGGTRMWWDTFFSKTLIIFHGSIVIAIIVVLLVFI